MATKFREDLGGWVVGEPDISPFGEAVPPDYVMELRPATGEVWYVDTAGIRAPILWERWPEITTKQYTAAD